MNIHDLLDKMREFEDGTLEFNVDDHKALFEAARDKIDGYKELLDEIELKVQLKKKYAEEMIHAAKVLENKAKALSSFLVYAMGQHNMPFIKGKRWQVDLRKRKKIVFFGKPAHNDFIRHMDLVDVGYRWIEKEPTFDTHAKLQAAGIESGVVELSYDWNKKKVQDILEGDNTEEISKIAKIDETVFVQFKPTKELK